jgi:hypothetical protein
MDGLGQGRGGLVQVAVDDKGQNVYLAESDCDIAGLCGTSDTEFVGSYITL